MVLTVRHLFTIMQPVLINRYRVALRYYNVCGQRYGGDGSDGGDFHSCQATLCDVWARSNVECRHE